MTNRKLGFIRLQQGFSIIEAVVTFVIVAVGLLALFNFNSSAMRINSDAMMRAGAINMAEAELEEVRGFISTDDYDAKMAAMQNSSRTMGDYTMTTSTTGAGSVNVSVVVGWTDSSGDNQSVRLESNVRRKAAADAGEDLRLAMVNSSGGYAWTTGGGQGGGSTGGGTPGGDDNSGSGDGSACTENCDGDYDDPATVYSLTISGGISTQGAARVELEENAINTNITPDSPDQFLNSCLTDGRTFFSCTVHYLDAAEGWSGNISFSTNKVFCLPSNPANLTIGYANIVNDITQPLSVANSSNKCSSNFDIVTE